MEQRDSRHTVEPGREQTIKMSSFGTSVPKGFFIIALKDQIAELQFSICSIKTNIKMYL